MDYSIRMYGRDFVKTPDGGLIEKGAKLPVGSTARIFDGAIVFAEAAANMHGGNFRGGNFRQSPSMAQRSDGYCFVAKYVDGELRIWAGCRNFSWEEALTHWGDDHEHGAESQRILHFIKAQEDFAKEKQND